MLTVDKLSQYGADVAKGMSRCAGSEMLYLRLVKMVTLELSSLGELKAALDSGDLDKGFAITHKLKGGLANLALDPVARPVGELTELLRTKTPGDYEALYNEICEKAEELRNICNS